MSGLVLYRRRKETGMKTINDLLSTGLELNLGKDINGNVTLFFKGYYIYEYPGYIGLVGRGKTVDEAADDYFTKIKGKTLVNPDDKSKRYVFI